MDERDKYLSFGAHPNAAVRKLKELLLAQEDALCAECAVDGAQGPMLCDGYRHFVRGPLRVELGACVKQEAREAEERIVDALRRSGVPTAFVRKTHGASLGRLGHVMSTAQGALLFGSKELPVWASLPFDRDAEAFAWKMMVGAVRCGVNACYVYAPLLYADYADWSGIVAEYGEVPFLVLAKVERGAARMFQLTAMTELLEYRYNRELPTLLLTDEGAKMRFDDEKRLREVILDATEIARKDYE